MRRFHVLRDTDVSGVSGTGFVAEGVVFENGQVALSFRGKLHAVEVLENIETVIAIHGHNGATRIVWLDGPFRD